ncbi:MAG: TonB-dependent receptor [Gammaproteobacteria bacterium]|nr:TonB-dependent receptor [Gammaproteobacteria bacterium]
MMGSVNGRSMSASIGFASVLMIAQWAQSAVASDAVAAADNTGLEEITVTAEKFKSTIQNTPISISALSGDQLAAAGLTRIQDIAHEIPGLSMRSAGPGLTEYDARGLASNGGAAPTVGFYLDEIPLSPPALSQSGKVVIDPDLYDVERVEVLRGPQGTLYGSGSMGGTVKVITNQPKLGVFEGSVQGTGSYTDGGSGNYSGNLMLNLPLGDKMALRVVLSDLYRSGWIDNITVSPFPVSLSTSTQGNVLGTPVTNIFRKANDERLSSARVSLLYKPTDDLSILATGFIQSLHLGGYDLLDGSPNSATPSRVYNAHYEAFPLREGVRDDISIFGITVNANVGFADLTSATAYWSRLGVQTQDASESIYWSNHGGTSLVPNVYTERDPSHQFSQEIRLTSHDTGALHWVAGAFYSELHSVWNEIGLSPLNVTPAVPDGAYFISWNPYTVKQTALFADGSYKITDQWKLSAGVRWYTYKSEQDEYSWGLDGPNLTPPAASLITTASDKGFNPRVDLSYMPNQDLTVYSTISKGFRPGGANQILPPALCGNSGTLKFGPDSAWNYEIGEKAKFLDNWLTVNADIYYIKWTGVQQVLTLPCGYQFYNNAGDGRSFGPELEINAKLTNELTASLSAAYTDAKITSPNASYTSFLSKIAAFPDGVTPPCPTTSGGCTAPIMNVVKDTASLSLSYATTVMGDYQLTARIADAFIGPSYDVAYYFAYKLPSYNLVNARVGLGHGAWSTDLFVDNLTNKVALMTANNTSFQFNIPQVVRYTTNQPRTVGIQANYKF